MLLWVFLSFLTLAACGAGALAFRAWRRRRLLDHLGRRHKMHPSSGREVEEMLLSLAGHWAQTGLRDVLEGRDGSGRYWAARRGWGREMQEVFIAELSRHTPAHGLNLESLHDGSLRMEWALTPERALDGQAREVVQRVLREFAAFKLYHRRPLISLQVGEKGAVLHAPMGGQDDRNAFIAAARVLRGDLLHCLYRRDPNPSGAVQPVDVERNGAPEADGGGGGFQAEETLHPDIDRALENLEPEPLVSAEELVAEKPAPPPKGWQSVKGKAVFEIPEPEEEVVVLQASASRTKAQSFGGGQGTNGHRSLFHWD